MFQLNYIFIIIYLIYISISKKKGCFSPFRSILRELVRGLGDDVLSCYEKFLERHYKDKENPCIDQNRALQAVFDLKFLTTVFGEPSKPDEV